jgi:hypothetical protein
VLIGSLAGNATFHGDGGSKGTGVPHPVQVIRSIVNPDKLRQLGPLSPIGRRHGV